MSEEQSLVALLGYEIANQYLDKAITSKQVLNSFKPAFPKEFTYVEKVSYILDCFDAVAEGRACWLSSKAPKVHDYDDIEPESIYAFNYDE